MAYWRDSSSDWLRSSEFIYCFIIFILLVVAVVVVVFVVVEKFDI